MRLAQYTLILLLFVCSLDCDLFAQQHAETPDSIRFKALGCLYHGIQIVNERNARLQGLQHELEEMQPLAPQNMDTVHFKTNLSKAAKYLSFLESHRREMAKNLRIISDSIKFYKTLLNEEDQREALDKFLSAYKEEASGFSGYTQRLSKMITDIHSALTFLLTVPMTRNGNDVTFNTDPSANQKYLDYESKLTKDQYDIDGAIDRTVKMSEKENKVIIEATSLLNR
jgi:hypothetical protein